MVEAPNIGINIEPRKFPQGFQWGTATAAFHVEGNSGERKSDWDSFIAKKKVISSDEKTLDWWVPGSAEHDFKEMKDLGLNAQRFGFEWARIEPEQGRINQEAIKRYRQMIDFLKKKDMSPMVTLSHFSLPEWVAKQGGWTNKGIRESFRHYAEVIADNFPDVPYWITINEPNVLAILGYTIGYWPPEKKGIKGLFSVTSNMIAAHELAGNELHKQGGKKEKVQVGIANQIIWFRPERENSKLDRLPVSIADTLFNYKFLNGTIENSDFAGINFYTGFRLKFRPGLEWHIQGDNPTAIDRIPFYKAVKRDGEIPTDQGVPIVPGFFLDVLQDVHARFKKSIIITENGLADKEDKLRSFYILTHLAALHEAVNRGVDIRGYYHFTNVDNLEWREGFKPRLGLVARDPKTGERVMRQSAKLYGEIARSNEIDVTELEKYLTPEQKELAKIFLHSLK